MMMKNITKRKKNLITKLNIMTLITEFIFGKPAKKQKTSIHIPKFKSTFPEKRISFEEWCKQFRVSCLHGKQIVYMD